jgi:nicotinamidase/pyrazinamidase
MGEQSLSAKDTGVIVVDVQADFTELKHGSLAVPGTDTQYVSAVETATQRYLEQGHFVYFTQDWHPADHVSFFSNNPGTEPLQVAEIDGRRQVMWPPHCVQNTPGAEILISTQGSKKTFRKGMDPRYDSYSGFADDGGRKTGLDDQLRQDQIKNLIIYGLATDVCVKATVLDARQAGYPVELIVDLCRGVSAETTEKAIQGMKDEGVVVVA